MLNDNCGYCGKLTVEGDRYLLSPPTDKGDYAHKPCTEENIERLHIVMANRLAPVAWETIDFLGHLAREDNPLNVSKRIQEIAQKLMGGLALREAGE